MNVGLDANGKARLWILEEREREQSCCMRGVNATENEGAEGISLRTERQTN